MADQPAVVKPVAPVAARELSGVEVEVGEKVISISFPAGDAVRDSTINHVANILQQLQRFKESDAVRSAVNQ